MDKGHLSLSTYLISALAVSVLLLAIVAPIVVRFYEPAEQIVRDFISLPPASGCWGCEAVSVLHDRFVLTEEASATIADTRDPLHGPEATRRVIASRASLSVLDAQIAACRADDGCREGPAAYRTQVCTRTWPDRATREAIADLTDAVANTARECREESCPVLDCQSRAQLRGALGRMNEVFTVSAHEASRAPDTANGAAELLAHVRESLEELPFLLTGTDDLALRSAEFVDLANAIAASADVFGWRARLVERSLRHAAEAANGDADWAELTRAAGAGLYQVQVLEWEGGQGLRRAGCFDPDVEGGEEVATLLRRAISTLDVCGNRAGCDLDTEAALELPMTRTYWGLAAELEYVAAALEFSRAELGRLDLAASPDMDLRTDAETYLAGEAIRLRIRANDNQCIADQGAWIGLFSEGSSASYPVYRHNLIGETEEIFAPAPEGAGTWIARAFAPETRGEAELRAVEFQVSGSIEVCEGFTGVWDTDFGTLHMVERDRAVRGSYQRSDEGQPGFFVGETSGRVMYGEWSSELGRGGVRLVLAADGRSFRGTWSHRPGSFAGTGAWRGTCTLEPAQ